MKHRILLFLLLMPTLFSAQPYAVSQLSLEKGLSNNYVVSIAQDKLGHLWFATEEGLNTFDGTLFTTYYKNSTGLTGNELNCLLDDPTDSVLWIGTQRSGLNAYNYASNIFSSFHHNPDDPKSLSTDDITNISPSSNGNLWVATYWKGINYLDKVNDQFTHYNQKTVPDLASDNIWAVADGGNGKLYVGHVFNGFSILSVQERTAKNFVYDPADNNSLPGNEVKCVYKDDYNNIWVGTNRGLALYNPEAENFIRFNTHPDLQHYIYDIRQFENHKLWIAMEFGGIAIMDLSQRMFVLPEQTRFQYIKQGDDQYSLSNATVRCLLQDSYKNVWSGVWGGGVNFLRHAPLLFSGYFYSSNPHSTGCMNNKTASSVCEDREGKLWIGTDGGGVNVFNRGTRIAIHKQETEQLDKNSVQASLCDSQGNLWFGLFMGGINYYDTQNKRFIYNFIKKIEHEDIRSFHEDKQGMLWVGTSNGIYQLSLSDKRILGRYSFGNNLVRCVIKDSKGRLWIGSYGSGLGIGDNHFEDMRQLDTNCQFPSNTINTLFEDSRQRVWVGTGEGLVCFDSLPNLTYTTYRREEGLNNIHIRAITEDRNGNIWVSTNSGISCLMKEEDIFQNYGHLDHVPLGNFMSGSVLHSRNGDIYFGSSNGLCRFNPEHVQRKQESPGTAITEMRVFAPLGSVANKEEESIEIAGTSKVRLNYRQNTFSLTFNVRNYALVNQVEYAYMLKGQSDAWYTVTDPNSVTFRNIPPGDYSFWVKSRIRNQDWSDETAMLDIRITPPIWLTWWAKLLYALSGLMLFAFLIQVYKRRLDVELLYEVEKKSHEQEQALNNERLRFYTNITHELRTPLTLILGPLEDMHKSNSLQPKDAQKVSLIHQSATRLLNLINQILEFRKTETQNKRLSICHDNLANLVYKTGLKYKELNRKSGIDIRIEVEKEDTFLYFDKEVITIILDNLIHNAIKYTEQGSITLGLHQAIRNTIPYIEITVSDTGYGIPPDTLPHIFERYYQGQSEHQVSGTGIGLALVKNLVSLHEGDLSVESNLGIGSSFCFSLLQNNTYPHALHTEVMENISAWKDKREELSDSSSAGKRILLVVEDNEDICHYIAESFADSFDVKTALNGKQGMELALNIIPDIIVSDIMMPIMSGTEMCKQLKEDVRTSHIPIILLTAKDTLQDKEEGYQVGADSYLTIPFSATLLHSRVHNLLDSRKQLAERFTATPSQNREEKRALLAESLTNLDNEFLETINQLIETRLSSEKIDIGYLADKLCMSKSTLYRKMKALTGLSSNEYVRKIKMQYAERLLLEGRYTISEIAFKVGINSVVYFRQCFKEEFGMLPSEYVAHIATTRS